MGAKQSSGTRTRTYSNAGQGGSGTPSTAATSGMLGSTGGPSSGGSGSGSRMRARSLGSVQNGSHHHHHHHHPLSIPSTNGGASGGPSVSPDSDDSTPEDSVFPPGRGMPSSLPVPVHLLPFHGLKCPVCSKFVPPDDIECHLVMCLTKPRISYNEDVLQEDKGECVICLDELLQGDTIARLPCLCIYHKSCIDSWFKVNRSCPEHPS